MSKSLLLMIEMTDDLEDLVTFSWSMLLLPYFKMLLEFLLLTQTKTTCRHHKGGVMKSQATPFNHDQTMWHNLMSFLLLDGWIIIVATNYIKVSSSSTTLGSDG